MKTWFTENRARFQGEVLFDVPLAKYSWYRIGGPAAVLVFPKSSTDLMWLCEGIKKTGGPFFVMGAASNLLISDLGFPGLVIKLTKLGSETQAEGDRLRAPAGAMISSLLRLAGINGWEGFEFLAGIPGTIGGAVRMNAGTHLGETSSALEKVRALNLSTGEELTYHSPLSFEYRKNLFLPPHAMVVETEWRFRAGDPEAVQKSIRETLDRRKASQPIDLPSCGSVFKNPPGHKAWEVIDNLGLRGHRIGDAQISEKHSNFIVNLGQAQAKDVGALIRLIKFRALREKNLTLEEEVIYLGDHSAV